MNGTITKTISWEYRKHEIELQEIAEQRSVFGTPMLRTVITATHWISIVQPFDEELYNDLEHEAKRENSSIRNIKVSS